MKSDNKQRALTQLQRRILSLDLAPGQALDEVVLCQQYGLSRTPLREVLQRLAGQGYVQLTMHRGAHVSSMDMVTMRNFFQTAPMVYAAISRLAVEHASADQLVTLKKIQMRFRRAVSNAAVADMVEQNHRFHEAIGEMAASPYLSPSLERLLIDHTRMSHRFYRSALSGANSQVDVACDQHDRLIAAIEKRCVSGAVAETLAHWELSRVEIDKYVQPDALPFDVLETADASESVG